MATVLDFGTVLQLTTTSSPTLSTTYNTSGSTSFFAGAASGCAIYGVFAFANGTSLTDLRVKMQVTYDGTNWNDVQMTRQDNGVTSVEHTITAASNTTSYIVFETTANRYAMSGCRIVGKCTGTLTAGDSITMSAVAA